MELAASVAFATHPVEGLVGGVVGGVGQVGQVEGVALVELGGDAQVAEAADEAGWNHVDVGHRDRLPDERLLAAYAWDKQELIIKSLLLII